MKRNYFTALYIIAFTALYIATDYYFPKFNISHYIVVWVLCGIYVGQLSMKYPKN